MQLFPNNFLSIQGIDLSPRYFCMISDRTSKINKLFDAGSNPIDQRNVRIVIFIKNLIILLLGALVFLSFF